VSGSAKLMKRPVDVSSEQRAEPCGGMVRWTFQANSGWSFSFRVFRRRRAGGLARLHCCPPATPRAYFWKDEGDPVVKALWYGYVTGPVLGVLWAFVAATTLAVVLSFSTGDAFGRVSGDPS
jgi:hypothetical protein